MLSISLTICAVILLLWITWRKNKLSFFEMLNIPGPPPSILYGNFWEILYEGQHNCIRRWIKEYGRVFGYYYGLRPVLVIADLDMLRQIQMKEFHKFSSRPQLFNVGNSSNRFNEHSLTVAQGKRWKTLRSIMTPTFTASKLKKMNPIINKSINELVEAVERESANGKPFDIYHLYQNLTMDVIARTSLGINTNSQTDKNEPFVRLARLIFALKINFLAMLTFSFREFMPIFSFIRYLQQSSSNKGVVPRAELQDRTASVIIARRSNPEYRRPDVLQLMMDAQQTEENVNDKCLTAGENEEVGPNDSTKEMPVKKGKGMEDEEIVQNCALFLLAGFETTSTALAFLTYCLVYNQDVQDKVREEINSNISKDEELTYESVHKLQYLDNVLNESLRLYPPITYFINRESVEAVTINKMKIPKGLAIQVPVHYLHHDPTIWEEPEIFNPDRFSPEERSKRHPMAFQPFGAGPRNCIGMRFAQMEAKMAIAKLLRKYRLLPKPGTSKEDFKIDYTIVTMRPKEGVVIQLERIS